MDGYLWQGALRIQILLPLLIGFSAVKYEICDELIMIKGGSLLVGKPLSDTDPFENEN
jgi:hypothetical protein